MISVLYWLTRENEINWSFYSSRSSTKFPFLERDSLSHFYHHYYYDVEMFIASSFPFLPLPFDDHKPPILISNYKFSQVNLCSFLLISFLMRIFFSFIRWHNIAHDQVKNLINAVSSCSSFVSLIPLSRWLNLIKDTRIYAKGYITPGKFLF